MGQYLHNLANTLIGQLNIEWRDGTKFPHGFNAQHLYENRRTDIRLVLIRMNPATLGKIVWGGLANNDPRTESTVTRQGVTERGKTSLYEVHCGAYLSKYDSGREILIELAITTIVAEMTDILRKRMEIEVARESAGYEGCLS